ncbi:uncharacterized protein EV154DRAFT_505607 [Mucor mucedo]|uniref:uncharacterized protein n=1 Tax=Mucor mucedo TaxID=29922 RepID=UPI00221E4001|nr:uncharacterized protein EV154DRAFT_505607 [Mucor mucedo]KAI7892337.1 hypothetical protein EV154DRAFT_505607 [Mucor mucedo]
MLDNLMITENYITESIYEEWLKKIYDYLQACAAGNVVQMDHEPKIKRLSLKYTISENRLYRWVSSTRYVRVPAVKERRNVLEYVHDGHGHQGLHVVEKRFV